MLIGRIAGASVRVDRACLRRPQRHHVSRGMAAMVAGGMIPIAIRRVIHIADNIMMFSDFIDMAVKRPGRAVPKGTGD